MNDTLTALFAYWLVVGGLSAVAWYCLRWPK